jgi:putative FmdB family regulatory protein
VPTYEYTCRDCGHTFEVVQSMIDDPLTMCPECGGSLRKVFAPPAISFKGSGFYATDHGKRSKRSDEGGDGKPREKDMPGEKDASGGKRETKETAAKSDAGPATKGAKKPPATAKEPAAS